MQKNMFFISGRAGAASPRHVKYNWHPVEGGWREEASSTLGVKKQFFFLPIKRRNKSKDLHQLLSLETLQHGKYCIMHGRHITVATHTFREVLEILGILQFSIHYWKSYIIEILWVYYIWHVWYIRRHILWYILYVNEVTILSFALFTS